MGMAHGCRCSRQQCADACQRWQGFTTEEDNPRLFSAWHEELLEAQAAGAISARRQVVQVSLQRATGEQAAMGGRIQPNVTLRGQSLELEALGCDKSAAWSPLATLKADCEVHYDGPMNEDVVLKVFKASERSELMGYEYVGCTHAMLAEPRVVLVQSHDHRAYFLGLEVFEGLNEEIFRGMSLPERQDLVRRHRRLECARCHEARPERADFLVSFGDAQDAGATTGGKLMRRLEEQGVSNGPWPGKREKVTLCTDRSLGLGVHVGDRVLLYYGMRLTFAQEEHPALARLRAQRGDGMQTNQSQDISPREAWFAEFAAAAERTKHGVLVLDFSPQYERSQVCEREFGRVRRDRLFYYVSEENSIRPWMLPSDKAESTSQRSAGWSTLRHFVTPNGVHEWMQVGSHRHWSR